MQLNGQTPQGLHAPSMMIGERGRLLSPGSIIVCLAFLFGAFTASGIAQSEYAYCYIGTTGLNKASFTFLYENTDTQATIATTAITVTEDPAGSKWYYFDALQDPTANFRMAASYAGNLVCDYAYPHGGYPVNVMWTNSYGYTVNANSWKQGDTRPSLTLTVPNFAQDTTGWVAKVRLWDASSDAVKLDDVAATVTQSGTGPYNLTFNYAWAATDLNMSTCPADSKSCLYLAEFRLVYMAVTPPIIETFPQNDTLRLTVYRKR